MRIGIAGVGRMGRAIAERLMEAGHEIVLWNRSVEKTEALQGMGAHVAGSPADLAARVETIITILTDEAAIDSVYRGPYGVLAADLQRKLVVEMSTVQPQVERRLSADVAACGADFVECPVGGTTGPARQGKLLGLVGGEDAALARARPLLDELCRRIEHVGPVGSGARMKLAINLPLLVSWQAFGEAMAMCRDLGKDPAWLVDLFTDTSGATAALRNRSSIVAALLAGDESAPPTFDIDSMRKDLRTMLAEGASLGIDLPLVRRTLAIYEDAAAQGWGHKDGAAIAAYWSSVSAR